MPSTAPAATTSTPCPKVGNEVVCNKTVVAPARSHPDACMLLFLQGLALYELRALLLVSLSHNHVLPWVQAPTSITPTIQGT